MIYELLFRPLGSVKLLSLPVLSLGTSAEFFSRGELFHGILKKNTTLEKLAKHCTQEEISGGVKFVAMHCMSQRPGLIAEIFKI